MRSLFACKVPPDEKPACHPLLTCVLLHRGKKLPHLPLTVGAFVACRVQSEKKGIPVALLHELVEGAERHFLRQCQASNCGGEEENEVWGAGEESKREKRNFHMTATAMRSRKERRNVPRS